MDRFSDVRVICRCGAKTPLGLDKQSKPSSETKAADPPKLQKAKTMNNMSAPKQAPPPPLVIPSPEIEPPKMTSPTRSPTSGALKSPSEVNKRGSTLRRTNRLSIVSPRPMVSPRGNDSVIEPSFDTRASGRGSSLRRSEARKTVEFSKLAPEEASEERKAKKGSFRESMVMPVGKSLRESMLISPEDRDAALAKINAMLGSVEPTNVTLACIMDGRVRKSLEVEAIDGIINGRSIQSAWNLSPEQELHVTFMGLRAPNGDEIPFETSDEVPWLHIPFWEEVIFPGEEYEILYEDDRDVDVDNLTDEEIANLEKEFDGMDVYKAGVLTREGLSIFFRRQHEKWQRDREGSLSRIMQSDLSKSRKARVGKTLKSDDATDEHIRDQVDHIMAMDVVGSGKIELHEYARSVAPDILVMRSRAATTPGGKGRKASNRSKRMSQRLSGVPSGFDPADLGKAEGNSN